MQGTWRVYLVSALVACVVAAATAFVTVRQIAPVGERTADPTPSAPGQTSSLIWEGVEDMTVGRKIEVFYKTPFAAPPNLTFPEGLPLGLEVTDQQAGSFKLKRAPQGFGPRNVKWKAEGQPAK